MKKFTKTDNKLVKFTRIIGCDFGYWDVWEKWDGHSTIMFDDTHGKIGRIGARRLPAELDVLPAMTQERSDAIRAWYNAQYREAYNAILTVRPDLSDCDKSSGEIRQDL